MKAFLVVCMLLIGSISALAEEPRELKAERGELLAIDDLQRRRSEVDQLNRQLEADAIAITSEIRAHHRIHPDDVLSFEKIQQGILVVRSAPAPVASSAVAAPASSSK